MLGLYFELVQSVYSENWQGTKRRKLLLSTIGAMFNGKSSIRYVGTGRQKDSSKSKLLSDARVQREKRVRLSTVILSGTNTPKHTPLIHSFLVDVFTYFVKRP